MRWFRRNFHSIAFYAMVACAFANIVAARVTGYVSLLLLATFCIGVAYVQRLLGERCSHRVGCGVCLPAAPGPMKAESRDLERISVDLGSGPRRRVRFLWLFWRDETDAELRRRVNERLLRRR